MIDKDIFTQKIHRKIEEVLMLINAEMKVDGDTEYESQRCCLINRMLDFEHCVNGVRQSDMKSSLK